MPTVPVTRNLIVAALAAGLASCTTANEVTNTDLGLPPAASQQSADTPVETAAAEGTEARYCPQASIREGTSTLQKKVDEALDYQAVIVNAKRDCRIVDGKLHITVGVEGRLMPGRAAKNRSVELPIRVAVVGQDGVIYSNLGKLSVPVEKGGTARTFRFVEDKIVIPPATGGIAIYTGFDEGPPKQG
ncbi:hypothetical protein [Jiella mangrovi]|uniref:Lipoprotein n=1 Tax=Jiella mangrovi TaxID=2821407 RepID=A0ABS4BEK6_9HYPH|nr:hypothetical protein [Jiella mangrovi]MBP0614494.1 hypothetical protein [Jiella mangrovi]